MKYLVFEMQTDAEGQVTSAVYTFDTQRGAEGKWHTVLSYAAAGELPMHAASVVRSDGAVLAGAYYARDERAGETAGTDGEVDDGSDA